MRKNRKDKEPRRARERKKEIEKIAAFVEAASELYGTPHDGACKFIEGMHGFSIILERSGGKSLIQIWHHKHESLPDYQSEPVFCLRQEAGEFEVVKYEEVSPWLNRFAHLMKDHARIAEKKAEKKRKMELNEERRHNNERHRYSKAWRQINPEV